MNIQLLAIDPQNDFCDLPAAYRPTGHAPSLPVAGAHADMQRLAAFIRAHAAGLDHGGSLRLLNRARLAPAL